MVMRKTELILQEVQKAVVGKDEQAKKILMTMLAKGHVLLEDIPGVGKTTMAAAFAKAMQLETKRIQRENPILLLFKAPYILELLFFYGEVSYLDISIKKRKQKKGI